MLHSTPKFRVPVPCFERLADSPFSTYSLSSCIAGLFELSEIPGRWEEHPDWYHQMINWAALRGFQVVEFDDEEDVVGYNLRMTINPEHDFVNDNGESKPGIEFLLFYGDKLQFNPSGIELQNNNILPGKTVFVPLDPAATAIIYN